MVILATVVAEKKRKPWYVAGLHFECQGCGGCCSGPGEGYIWVTRKEIELIAEFLNLSVSEFRSRYLRRVRLRTSIIEHSVTRDCIFLRQIAGARECQIYPVRPNQCRNWPFWPGNLANPRAWNRATRKCPGVNRGRLYTCAEIEKIKKKKKWWSEDES